MPVPAATSASPRTAARCQPPSLASSRGPVPSARAASGAPLLADEGDRLAVDGVVFARLTADGREIMRGAAVAGRIVALATALPRRP